MSFMFLGFLREIKEFIYFDVLSYVVDKILVCVFFEFLSGIDL